MKIEGTSFSRRIHWLHSLLIVCIVGANVMPSMGQGPTRTLQKRNIVDLHNFYRRFVANTARAANMKKIFWDESLAIIAREVVKCENIWKSHQRLFDEYGEMDEFTNFYRYGVNTAQVPRKTTMDSIIKNWLKEGANYDFAINQCSPETCLNYSQLITAETDRVGCATNTCPADSKTMVRFIACMYSPALGSRASIGEKPYKDGASCSKCGNTAAFCDKGLCVPCLESDPRLCDCRKTCKSNEYGKGVLNRSSCTCKCEFGSGTNCDEPCVQDYEEYYDDCEGQDCTDEIVQNMCPSTCNICKPIS